VWGDKKAYYWLKQHGFELLVHLSDAAQGDEQSLQWFKREQMEVFILIAKKTEGVIKRKQHELSDYHKMHF
jgi:hypothetical protein